MSVKNTHPEYDNRLPDWSKIRDCIQGERHIKNKGEAYLKKSAGQLAIEKQFGCTGDQSPYAAYKDGARFPDIVDATVQGFVGLATRKAWDIQGMPSSMDYLIRDAGNGIALDEWQGLTIAEGLEMGRYAMFPDAPIEGGQPKISWYQTEYLPNWRTVAGRPSLVVLKESIPKEDQDIFAHDSENQYRVIRMEGNSCFVDLYNDNGDMSELYNTIPLLHHEGYCPVVVGGAVNNDWAVDKPPVIGIAECAIAYYRLSAQQRWAIKATCDPMFLALGFQPGEIEIWGGGSIFEKADVNARIDVIEVDGSGIDKATIEMQAELQAAERMSHQLTDKASAEASKSLRQRTNSKTASLKSVDRCAASAFERALNIIAKMNNIRASITVTSSFDYTDEEIEATALTAISNAVEKNQLPVKSVTEYVKQRGMLENMSMDDVLEELAQEKESRDAESVGLGGDFGGMAA